MVIYFHRCSSMASKPHQPLTTASLKDPIVKTFLLDLESSDLTRQEFSLQRLAQDNEFLYGESGSLKRRNLQKIADQIKQKDPLSYKRFLKKVGVAPGKGTKRQILLAEQVEDQKLEQKLEQVGSSVGSSDSERYVTFFSSISMYFAVAHMVVLFSVKVIVRLRPRRIQVQRDPSSVGRVGIPLSKN